MRKSREKIATGFTLIELLMSMAILTILMMVVTQVLSHTQRAWKQASSKVSQFREARRAFDRIVFSLGQAAMNPYMVYYYPESSDPLVPPSKSLKSYPSGYRRFSELQFVCGPSSSANNPRLTGLSPSISPGHAVFFQAPLGSSSQYRVPTGMNGCGFFVQFADDTAVRPDFLSTKGVAPTYRYRLMEYRAPVETNSVYDLATRTQQSDWYADFSTRSQPIANNIVLLLVSPKRALQDNGGEPTDIAPSYSYNSSPGTLSGTETNSEYQLPPLVEVTLVAIDEASARLLGEDAGSSPPLSAELLQAPFTQATGYRADLINLENALVAKKVNFRIFNATVPIRASKWGRGT